MYRKRLNDLTILIAPAQAILLVAVRKASPPLSKRDPVYVVRNLSDGLGVGDIRAFVCPVVLNGNFRSGSDGKLPGLDGTPGKHAHSYYKEYGKYKQAQTLCLRISHNNIPPHGGSFPAGVSRGSIGFRVFQQLVVQLGIQLFRTVRFPEVVPVINVVIVIHRDGFHLLTVHAVPDQAIT